eukprot:Skav229771  [mRNA]  locus=scaffold4146:37817:40982:+ [translate_table: standard]
MSARHPHLQALATHTAKGRPPKEMAEAKNGKKKDEKKAIKATAKVAAKGRVKHGTYMGPQINLEPPSGTRDFFPAEMRMQNYMFGTLVAIPISADL